jgi:shikimate dehydrogenase
MVGARRPNADGPVRDRTRLGVLGWPVAHSRSPVMQNAALRAVGLRAWRYQLLPVPPALFAETVRGLPGAGFRGANVTIPHKQDALLLASEASDAARTIGAANTLLFDPAGGIVADNTDAPALIAALPAAVSGRTALVLGAGGSARATVWALLEAGAGEVFVWNRNPERARELAEQLGGSPTAEARPADFLINCTPSGLDGDPAQLKQLPVNADELGMFGCVVDFAYGDAETSLIHAARARGLPVVDGLDLLVGQGALSFERFTGRPAPVEEMRTAARGR